MPPLKKALLALSGLLILGSLSFALTGTNSLQGNFKTLGENKKDTPAIRTELGSGAQEALVERKKDLLTDQTQNNTPASSATIPDGGIWSGSSTPGEEPTVDDHSTTAEVAPQINQSETDSPESTTDEAETSSSKERTKPKNSSNEETSSSSKPFQDRLNDRNTASPSNSSRPNSSESGTSRGTALESASLRIRLLDYTEENITGLNIKNFNAGDTKIVSVTEADGIYTLEFRQAKSIDLRIQAGGFLSKNITQESVTGTDQSVDDVTLYYGRTITVKDEEGNLIYNYTATAGLDQNDEVQCVRYIGGTYGCAFPASAVKKGLYKVEVEGYEVVEGEFDEPLNSNATKGIGETVTVTPLESSTSEVTSSTTTEITTDTNSIDTTTQNTGTCTKVVDLRPDSYSMTSANESIQLTISVENAAIAQNFWTQLWSSILMANVSAETDTTALILKTNGKGILSGDNGKTGKTIQWKINGDSTTVTAVYQKGAIGDTLTASIRGQEDCDDTLTLTGTEEELSSEETSTPRDSKRDALSNTRESQGKDSAKQDNDNSNIMADENYICKTDFNDIDQVEQQEAICRLYDAKVVKGRSQTKFAPNEAVTRAEYIKMLLLSMGYTENDFDSTHSGFQDVTKTDWFAPYLSFAENLDIIRVRDSGDHFNPNLPITRADAAVYGARGYERKLYDFTSPFKDVPQNAPFAYAVTLWNQITVDMPNDNKAEVPVIGGYSDSSFHPYDYITRADTAALMIRMALAE